MSSTFSRFVATERRRSGNSEPPTESGSAQSSRATSPQSEPKRSSRLQAEVDQLCDLLRCRSFLVGPIVEDDATELLLTLGAKSTQDRRDEAYSDELVTPSKNLLDAVYSEAQHAMKQQIAGKSGTLIQDGWSNVHNDPIVATSLQVEGKTFFLDSVDTGAMTKNGNEGEN